MILITGGAGFIGAQLAGRLIRTDPDIRIRVVDTLHRDALALQPWAKDPRIEVIQGDIRDQTVIDQAMDGVHSVVHAASIAGIFSVGRSAINTMWTTLAGTYEVLQAATKHRVQRVVLLSTSEVYGINALDAHESQVLSIPPPTDPRWSYASSKLAAEQLAASFMREKGLNLVTIRPFNIYGPGQIGEGAMNLFIQRALKEEPLLIHGDGLQIRAWCFIDDLIDGLIAALTRPEAVGHCFNIGNPQALISVRALAERIIDRTHSSSTIQSVPALQAEVHQRSPDIGAAQQRLNFTPKVDLMDGLDLTIQWYRAQYA